MSRNQRKLSATRIYHIVIKGADRQLLFEEISDYKKYLSFLEYYKEQCHFELFAYCLMSNHIHLLLRHSPEYSLESVFRRLNTAYATWFNMKYNRTGFVQNNRYYSEPVETDAYLYNVVRYIHFNPTEAGLEHAPGTSYRWSSYFDYVDPSIHSVNITDTAYLFSLLGSYKSFLELHENISTASSSILDIHTLRKRLPDDVAAQIILEISNCHNSTEFQNLTITKRDAAILSIHKKGVSVRQINRLTGTPRGIVERIIRRGKFLA